jgi:alpha-1,3-glucosyltransferase
MSSLTLSPLFPTIKPFRSTSTSIALVLLLGLFLRCCIGLGPHSGYNIPPRFGDFEAQRHWMEITLHLPIEEWYGGKHKWNDLQYWGLDYPPLTAYHSKLCGKVLNWTLPESVQLGISRGNETLQTRSWMRALALISDLLTYFPAMMLYFSSDSKLLLLAIISPTMIVIDHGHFQFNSVAHGFVVFAVLLLEPHVILGGRHRHHHHHHLNNKQPQSDLTRKNNSIINSRIPAWKASLASIFFCLALNFKQMTLYYSPAFFFFLLIQWCIFGQRSSSKVGDDSPNNNNTVTNSSSRNTWLVIIYRVMLLGATVLGTFLIIWLPFLSSQDTLFAVVRRVFPFERGIFEDKVGNFWCTINAIVKIRSWFSQSMLAIFALVLTVLFSFVPIAIGCVMKSSKSQTSNQNNENQFLLRQSLFVSSLGFFLFSFQVHEKSILLPSVASLLLLPVDPFMSILFQVAAMYGMVPLLTQDGIIVTSTACTGFFVMMAYLAFGLPRTLTRNTFLNGIIVNGFILFHFIIAMILCVLVTNRIMTPLPNLPDLWIVLLEGHAFGLYVLFYGWGVYGLMLSGVSKEEQEVVADSNNLASKGDGSSNGWAIFESLIWCKDDGEDDQQQQQQQQQLPPSTSLDGISGNVGWNKKMD